MSTDTKEQTREQVASPGRINTTIRPGMPYGAQADPNAPRHTRIVIDLPPEAAAELDQLRCQTGDSHAALFRKALTLYKLAREAIAEGKSVGVAETADALETRFVGL
jgi:hypothetical protein